MILTCLTKDFVVQASDRRLVYRARGKIAYKEDDRNKALFYENHSVFAYTGLATLSDQKFAIDWAAEHLAQSANFQDAMGYLCECATQLMGMQPFSTYPNHQKRLAFVGAGFIKYVEGTKATRRPAFFIISNFMDQDGEQQSPPYNRFRAYCSYPLPMNEADPGFALLRSGQPLPGNGENQLKGTLKTYFQRVQGAVSPEMIGWLLTRAIQEAAETNVAVGKNIICTFVPRSYRKGTGVEGGFHIGGMIMNLPAASEEPQQLTPPGRLSDRERFMMPPLVDVPRCLYIPGDSSALPLYKAVHVGPGQIVPELCITDMVVTVPPVRSTGDGGIEIAAGDWSTTLSAKLIDGKWV